MKYILVVISSLLFLISDANAIEANLYGMPKTNVVPIKDTINDRQYELLIKLPEGYEQKISENKTLKYPVIYFTDAVWHIEMLSASTEYMMENVILVGISWQKDINPDLKAEVGPYASRFRDYSAYESTNEDNQKKLQYGQASKHLAFIRNDVIPFVEDNYRTESDTRTYFGYSMGAEFGVYALTNQPNTFKNYILGSPSLRKRDVQTIISEQDSMPKNFNSNVFITFGSEENRLGQKVLQLVTFLKNRKDESLVLTNKVIDGTHQTAFPGTTIMAISWLSKLQQSMPDKE